MATFTDNGGGAPNGSELEFTYTFPIIQTEDEKDALLAEMEKIQSKKEE